MTEDECEETCGQFINVRRRQPFQRSRFANSGSEDVVENMLTGIVLSSLHFNESVLSQKKIKSLWKVHYGDLLQTRYWPNSSRLRVISALSRYRRVDVTRPFQCLLTTERRENVKDSSTEVTFLIAPAYSQTAV